MVAVGRKNRYVAQQVDKWGATRRAQVSQRSFRIHPAAETSPHRMVLSVPAAAPTIAGADKGFPQSITLWA